MVSPSLPLSLSLSQWAIINFFVVVCDYSPIQRAELINSVLK